MPEDSVEIKESFTEIIITNNYPAFFCLANEMVHRCQKEKDKQGQFRYAMAAVIFSFTTIENFISYIFNSDTKPFYNYQKNMSSSLSDKIDRLSIIDKIEFLFLYIKGKDNKLYRGQEPFQSFDLLRQLRNFVVHYTPREEVIYTTEKDYKKEVLKFEKKIRGRFQLKKDEETFLYRCFNKHCAAWSFNLIEKFIDWFCEEFEVRRPKLEKKLGS